MQKTKYFHDSDAANFFKLLTDKRKKVSDFCIVSSDMLQVEYTCADGFVQDNDKTNIFIGTFTTCWARLRLYEQLDIFKERVIYMDTDSLIIVSKPGEQMPRLGAYLGDLTSEISAEEGGYIVEIVAPGPKNYAYVTAKGTQVCKIRGFSLNFTNKKVLNFDSLKNIVLHDKGGKKTVVNPGKICRNKKNAKIFNRPEEKVYGLVYTKRVLLPNLDTVPYGYVKKHV